MFSHVRFSPFHIRRARGGVCGHHLRVLQLAIVLNVIRDAGCAHRMIADVRFDSGLSRVETEDFLGQHRVPLAVIDEADPDREAALVEAAARRNPR